MACNFPDEMDVNALTIEANDPISKTAEFKATAVKVEKTNEELPQESAVAETIDRDRPEKELATANEEG